MTHRAARTLARHYVLSGALVALIVLAAGAALVAQRPTTYTATTVFSLIPRRGTLLSATAMQQVAASYQASLSSTGVMGKVADRLGESRATVAGATAVAIDTDTANLRVEVTLPSARRAVAVANLVAIEASDHVDRFVSVDFAAPAIESAAQVKPPRRLLLLVVAVIAVGIGLSVSFVAFYRRCADVRPHSREG